MIYQLDDTLVHFLGLWLFTALQFWPSGQNLRPSGFGLMDPPPYYYYETWIYSISVEFDLTSHLLRQEEMFGPITASGIFKAVVEAVTAVVNAVTSVDIVNATPSDDASISPNG